LVLKRVVDVLGGLALLVLVSPVLLAAAVAIRVSSPGPVFFRQQRVGRAGRPFTILKLRTMVLDQAAVMDLSQVFDYERGLFTKRPDDPRVTKVGRLLRRTSGDELPQLLNVLRGDMSLIGPRPVVDYMLRPFPDISAERCRMKPGITGLWQVLDRHAHQSVEVMAAADLAYVRRFSLSLDLRIALRTIPVWLRGDGAF
jgi:lipopolysaccharide/colanic/teichoic acid biosynthesis glycosyltransferase